MSNWKPNGLSALNLASIHIMRMTTMLRIDIGKRLALLLMLVLCLPLSTFAKANGTHLDQPLSNADARHLFSRTGFGYSLAQHDLVKGMSRREAIDVILSGFRTEPFAPMPAWVDGDAPYFWSLRDMERADRVRFERDRDLEISQLRQWWISEMLQTPSPQTERLVLFWHDLMPTSYHGVNYQSVAMARQNAMFRQLGLGRFEDLLKAIIRDPAMLNYLDNENSRKQSPNENLARELLERFSMGEGNYHEDTVKEAARALTGYGVSHDYNLAFRFQTWKHDKGEKNLFGQTGKFTGDDLVALIMKQDATAEFIAGKFWRLLVSDKAATTKQLAPLTAQLKRNDYDLAALYQSILMTEAFWQEENRIARVKSPVTLQIAAARSLEYPKMLWQSMSVTSASLGMSLFAPPNVSGWNEGTAFTTAGRLKQRKGIFDNLLGIDSSNESKETANVMGNMMQPMTNGMMSDNGFSITMAAENYEGPANYRLELHADSVLWKSDEQAWLRGHDTQRFGRVGNMANMPWHRLAVTAPAEAIKEAKTLRVLFLNDNAGPDGDRNLYVRGLELAGAWYPASLGVQTSRCVPKNPANAGNLWCNGHIDIPIASTQGVDEVLTDASYQVGDVRVRWGNANVAKKERLELTLESVATPHQRYRNISVELRHKGRGKIDLRLNSYSCWPDCFSQLAECLWRDDLDGTTRIWSFALRGGNQCHYRSLTASEQELIDSIWMSIPALVSHAAKREQGKRYEQAINRWVELTQDNRWLPRSVYARSGEEFVFNSELLKKPYQDTTVNAPPILLTTAEQLHSQLQLRNLTVFDLVLPGIEVNAFPQLSSAVHKPIAEQLDVYSKHAVSQLY